MSKSIVRVDAHCFRARDGSPHPTWNTARKHTKVLDVTDSLRAWLSSQTRRFTMSEVELDDLARTLLRDWHMSRPGDR